MVAIVTQSVDTPICIIRVLRQKAGKFIGNRFKFLSRNGLNLFHRTRQGFDVNPKRRDVIQNRRKNIYFIRAFPLLIPHQGHRICLVNKAQRSDGLGNGANVFIVDEPTVSPHILFAAPFLREEFFYAPVMAIGSDNWIARELLCKVLNCRRKTGPVSLRFLSIGKRAHL